MDILSYCEVKFTEDNFLVIFKKTILNNNYRLYKVISKKKLSNEMIEKYLIELLPFVISYILFYQKLNQKNTKLVLDFLLSKGGNRFLIYDLFDGQKINDKIIDKYKDKFSMYELWYLHHSKKMSEKMWIKIKLLGLIK